MLFLLSILTSLPVSTALNVGMDTRLTKSYASFYGEYTGDNAGTSVDIAGDVNGDGYADMIIGSPNNHDTYNHAGKAYLVLGKSSGLSLGMNLSKADASWRGEGVWDQAGNSVSGAGDVNGDGYDDLIIAAHYNSSGGISGRGKVYIIFGKPSGWAKNVSLANADASFLGETVADYAGDCVNSLGDVNGDGYDDIIIGAANNDEGGSSAGQAYIIFGKASGWKKDVNLSGADASFIGEGADNLAGYSVAGPGDLNGDHLDDILIGAPESSSGKSYAGMVYVIFGKTVGWAMNVKLSSNNVDASYIPEADGDWAGDSVSGAGDVNGDGLKDFLVGAFYSDKGTFETGQAYVVLGKKNGWAKGVGLGTVAGSYRGEGQFDWAGYTVGSAGDADGDGYDDILIDSGWNSEPASHAGQAYMIRGKAAGWAQNVILNNADASWWAEPGGSGLGESMGGGGDVNGDGYDDFILGEYYSLGGGAGSGGAFLISPDQNTKPASITSVSAYSDPACTNQITFSKINSTVYVQLAGAGGGNASKKDVVVVNVSSNESAKTGIRLTLTETGLATGTYRGSFEIRERTHSDYGWIAAKGGETVTIKSADDGSKKATLYVAGKMIKPDQDQTVATEDQKYDVHYSGLGWVDEVWDFTSNGSWLSWNSTSHDIEGLPDNGDVGQYKVWLNVSYASGALTDQRTFNLTVNNVPPAITTTNELTASEDTEYRVDYNSTDDGQGTVTWHLSTNATGWLKLDPQTGVLNGTPSNSNIGKYRVNLSVDDGNGGKAYSNFTLTVKNVNDPPKIITENNLTATQNQLYEVHYQCSDPDVGDTHTWSMQSNASVWLAIEPTTGRLFGTPYNQFVGWFWVNVTVKDAAGASDFTNFTLTVLDVNDLPVITSLPMLEATVYSKYYYPVKAFDPDAGSVLSYSLETSPTGMSIDPKMGLLQWLPTPDQKGDNLVDLMVSDGIGAVHQTYNITVTEPAAWPPVTTLLEPHNDADLSLSTPLLKWKWEDKDSTEVTFEVYLGTDLSKVSILDQSMRIVSGNKNGSMPVLAPLALGSRYYWTVVGNDGKNTGPCLSGVWSFNVSTSAKANHGPTITSIPPTEAYIGIVYRYQIVATDADQDPLSYRLVMGPIGMTVDAATGLTTWTPSTYQVGFISAIVSVTDNILRENQLVSLTVSRPNNPPHLDTITDQAARVGKTFKFPVQATDKDGDKLNYNLTQRPEGMTISDSGLISWKPTKDQTGTQTVTVAVSDGKNQTSVTFKIEVKKAQTQSVLGGFMIPLLLVIVIVVIAVVVLAVMLKKKKKGRSPVSNTGQPLAGPPVQQSIANPSQGEYYPPPQSVTPAEQYQSPARPQYQPQDGTYQYPNQQNNQQPPTG